MTDRTILVAVMLGNNEVGTLQPVAEIARVVRARRGILFHVDAVQAAAWMPLDVGELGADLVALAAHKAEGPKGTGALWIRKGTHILAQQQGGSQERHRRAGTENVAGAVGMATAFELAAGERVASVERVRTLRDRLLAAVLAVDGVEPTGHPVDRLPHILSILARDIDGGSVALALDLEGIAASTGSACSSGSDEVSHVLTAMGYPVEEARGALRLSLGRTTTDAEIDDAARIVPEVLRRLIGAAPHPSRAVAG
jgi:cysteine desulfurase